MPFERSFETGKISVMKGSIRVLVNVVLRGCSQPQNYATAIFFANSKRPTLGLSNEVSFVPKNFSKGCKNKGNVFPLE